MESFIFITCFVEYFFGAGEELKNTPPGAFLCAASLKNIFMKILSVREHIGGSCV